MLLLTTPVLSHSIGHPTNLCRSLPLVGVGLIYTGGASHPGEVIICAMAWSGIHLPETDVSPRSRHCYSVRRRSPSGLSQLYHLSLVGLSAASAHGGLSVAS